MTSIINAKTALLLELLRGPDGVAKLVERVAARSQRQVVLTLGCSYPALKDMEADGLVALDRVPGAGRSGPPALRYTITPAGRELALQQRAGLQALFAEDEGT